MKKTDAQATVKFAILSAIVSNWHKKFYPDFAEMVTDEIFNKIFDPHLKWAVEEYLKEIQTPKKD